MSRDAAAERAATSTPTPASRGSLRAYLLALAAVAVVPILGLATYLTVTLSRTEQQAIERGLEETTSALVTATDRSLMITLNTLEALATSRDLDAHDYGGFLEDARRVLRSQAAHGWVTIELASPDGAPLLHTSLRAGATAPRDADPESLLAAASGARPTVSGLMIGPVGHQPVYGVRLPVMRDGIVRYVLTATLAPRAMAAAFESQHGVPDRIAVLYDRRNTIVYRTVNADRLIGTPVTPHLAAESAGREAGMLSDVNREGTAVRTVFQRSRLSGWVVAVGVPERVLYAAQRRSLWTVLGAGAGVIVLSALLIAALERRIRRPIASLTRAVQAVGRGEAPGAVTPGLREATEAFVALQRTAALLVERHQREAAARAEAEASSRAKDQFLATLSHELRTPLNAVYGWARMLRTGQIDAAASTRALEAIERNADAQVRLIDDLLDLSRVITGKMRLDVRAVDLPAVLESALDAVRPAAAAKAIRLETVLDPRAGPITGDPDRLQQVVWNLLMNAVKFTPRGGRVQLYLQRVNSHVEIVVSDTGRGIAPDVLPFVFDRFRQGDSSSTREHAGLGLGLALVKHLVELHGGSVVARSPGEGHGATFVVKLPVRLDATPAAAPESTAAAGGTAVRLDGLRVLVVDDQQDALDLASAILVRAGAEVRGCLSAGEGVEEFGQWRPDVLVSDIEMPGEDGYSLIRKVRALGAEHGGKTPAVALTAHGRTQDRILSLMAGYSMHVPKPVDPAELVTIIASVAGRAA